MHELPDHAEVCVVKDLLRTADLGPALVKGHLKGPIRQ